MKKSGKLYNSLYSEYENMIYFSNSKNKGNKMNEYNHTTEEVEVELTQTQKKIKRAKEKITTVKAIENLEKEVARLEKKIVTKRARIEELAQEL